MFDSSIKHFNWAQKLLQHCVLKKTCLRKDSASGILPLFQTMVAVLCMIGVFGLSPHPLAAQQGLGNLHTKTFSAPIPIQKLDSFTVIQPWVAIVDAATGQPLDFSLFVGENNRLLVDTAQMRIRYPACSKYIITYRTLPIDLGAKVSRLDTAAIRKKNAVQENYIGFDYSPYEPQKNPWETAGMNTNGAYTRGFSFGNTQNLVFNSNLNLQLDGKLGNDLELKAAISDNSVPIQPDGTTRQLQEFDRIFIQLKRKNAILTAGDYDLTRPNSYFLNYFKRMQGAQVEIKEMGHGLRLKKNVTLPASKGLPAGISAPTDTLLFRSSAAVSKGKFARQIIQGKEGNQGPYRLVGAEGEQFIIVLAGTEKVFLDGQVLVRGLQDDYVIDYNLGELVFTAKRLITKDSRVVIEFEYATQLFLRSTIASTAEWHAPKTTLRFNYYSEQDAKNAGGAQDLSSAERRTLALIGDQLRDAYASGVDTSTNGFDVGRIQYKQIDSLVCGVPVSILIYSNNPDSAKFVARFSQVQQGQGNYVQVNSSANGRVFKWVAPDPVTCQPTGNFEPIVRLIAPELRQMYTFGGHYQPNKNGAIRAEVALSNRDLNRFSPLGNNNNIGVAASVGFQQALKTSPAMAAWKTRLSGNYEYAAKTFNPLNPYRPAEFSRDWNADPMAPAASEHLAKGGFQIKKDSIFNTQYEFGLFVRQNASQGTRHFGQVKLAANGYTVFIEGNLLQTGSTAEQSLFLRPKLDVSKMFFGKYKQKNTNQLPSTVRRPLFKIGAYGEREKNARYSVPADTLTKTSFWYDLGKVYFQIPETQRMFQVGGFLLRRNDFFPHGQSFAQNTAAKEANLNGAWRTKERAGRVANQQLQWNLTARRLRILAPELTPEKPQETYLGRIDYTLNAWKNALALTSGYEVGSGQSPKIEFNYLEVNPGEGVYTWVDRNRDSVLTVDEMEIAVFQDQASYIRVAVTTTSFIRTNNVLLNQSLRLEPRLIWSTRKGFRKHLSRYSLQSTLQINRKTLAEAGNVTAWNPFELNVADTSLVTVSSSVRNALFFNRANPKWDVSLTQSDNRNRVVLTTGFENRRLSDWVAHGRINISRPFTAEADLAQGLKTNYAQSFANRSYVVDYWEITPQATWIPTRQFRTVLKYHWQKSQNSLEFGGETAQQTDWNIELTWNPVAQANQNSGFKPATALRFKSTFAQVKFDGESNSAIGYAMLEGLQNGRNFLWGLSLDRQLSKSLQMSLTYEGRKTGDSRIVNVGRAQVRAIF